METRKTDHFCPLVREIPGRSVDGRRLRVPYAYISCPFDGDLDKYLKRVRPYCDLAIHCGYVPITPYIMYGKTMPADLVQTNDRLVKMSTNLMLRCDEFWLPPFEDSEFRDNVMYELTAALRNNKRIRFPDEIKEAANE